MAGAVVMRAVAGERRLTSRILAVLRAVLLSVRADATADRMRTLLGFRHRLPPSLLLSDNRPALPSCFSTPRPASWPFPSRRIIRKSRVSLSYNRNGPRVDLKIERSVP